MRSSCLRVLVCALLTAVFAGCGGGNGGGGGSSANATDVTFTFTGGTPTAAAAQIGTGNFAAATIQSGKVVVSVPSGTTNYAIAYVCPPVPGFGNTVTGEFIIEASLQDGHAFTVSCEGASTATTGTITGSVDASVISGAANIDIVGLQGIAGSVGSNNGTFSLSMPTGANDVALVVVDNAAQPNVLAVKILRSQTVPGAMNGGSTIIFSAGDQITTEPLTINNVPASFVTPPAVAVTYTTANGTSFLVDNHTATTYPAIPTGATQSGDFYGFEANTDDTATHNSAIGITQTTTSGGGAATISLPAPWTFAGPAAATFPTFTFTYSGFSNVAAVAQQGEIEWAPTATTLNTITVTATGNFQAGATTITTPDLSALTGFIAPAPSGTTIDWVADIFGGTAQEFTFFPAAPSNGSLAFVQNEGTYTQP
jgi:hypothetical protein